MNKNFKNEGHGTIRKNKAFGAIGVIALSGALLLGSYQSVAADEILSSAPAVEVSSVVPDTTTIEAISTNEVVSEEVNADAPQLEEVNPIQEVVVEVEVEMPENLNTAIETAEQTGVVVTESEEVVYNTKEEAQNDYNEQVKTIEQAVEEQAQQNAAYIEEKAKYEKELAKQEEVVKQYKEEVKQYEQQVEQNKQAELVNKALEEEYAEKISGIVEVPNEEQEKVETKDEIESRLATTSNVEIKDATVLADGVLLEKGESEGVDVQILTFDKAGDYELVLKTFDSQSLTPGNLEAGINELGAVAIVNGGFWSYGSVDSSWTQREFSLGKTGYIASSGNNNFLFGDYNTSLASDVMEFQGLGGFNIGAFGLLIKDGIIDYAWKTKLTGSDASDTGRNLLIETNDGQIKIVQNYGHSSKGTGWSIADVYDYLESMNVSTIKNAFMLDGGGSTRMATKAIDGNEIEVTGAFVDNRTTTHYLALVKTGTVFNDQVVVVDKNKVAEGTSKSVTPAQYFASKNEGKATVTGTQHEVKGALQANKRKYSTPITKNEFGRTVITIKTQSDLETFLDDDLITERDYIEFKNTEDLVFPQRVYQVKKWADWYITEESTGDIDFNNSTFLIGKDVGMSVRTTGTHLKSNGENQVLKNVIIIGSVNATIETKESTAKMLNASGGFSLAALQASNMTFRNMKFYAAHVMSNHLFDIMGSSNIIFDGIQAFGYGMPNMTKELLVKFNNDNAHRIFSEAIQIDAAYAGGAGETPNIKNEWNRQIWTKEMFDGAGSHDIVIANSLFTNYTGPTGHSIMAGTNEESVYTYGATVGSHGMDSAIAPHFKNIVVQNSQFDNTIYNPVSKDKVNYPIHFLLYKLTEEEVASLKSINNTFTNIRGTNYSNNGVAGTTAKWNGDSYLSFYAGEPIEEPQYLPIVKVEKPIEPDLPELVKPVKPDPVKVSYHLVKVKEKQPVTSIETPAEEVDKPADNGATPSTPISPVEEETAIAETPIVSAEPEQPSMPEVAQTEDKEVKVPSAENSSNPTKEEVATNNIGENEKIQQSQAEKSKTSQNSSSNEPNKKAETAENNVKNEAKSNTKPSTSSSASSTNKADKKQNYSAAAKTNAKATSNNSIIAVVAFALALIGSGLGFLFWKHLLKK